MAGHSKWANIKHRKARQDAAKGKTWSKCSRAIIVAARQGGDPDFNLALRYAIDEAKAANMPKDTIAKAIKRGTGVSGGTAFEEVRYEGYGPAGVAIIVDCLTDNVNRTAPEMRKLFEKHGGNLAKPGAVAFGFEQKGLLLIEAAKATEDQLMEAVLEAGADDVAESDGAWEVTCPPGDLQAVKEALGAAEIEPDSAEITMLPATTVACDPAIAAKVLRLIDALEDHDDVQKVFHNADIPDEVMQRLEA
ncbi:MAG: YebC/PmpR family DNA-binding transcriptional regulator [Planctomycetes bacterium]|nr:YebC/PmpR family DNA-binding transcriptional regulator [Planctomycetota bacterium]